jgi:phenylacetate-CoA ligase
MIGSGAASTKWARPNNRPLGTIRKNYRKYWNEEEECISPDVQRGMEQEKLARQLEYVYANAPFYRSKFDQVGLKPGSIRHVEDLSRLPFTTKAELRESQEQTPPFGDYLAAPKNDVSIVHRTSGSTGRFIFTVMTKNDLRQTNEIGARSCWSAGIRPHNIVVHCLNYQLWMGGYTDHSNLEAVGAAVIPYGVGSSKQLVRIIEEARATGISSTPSYPNVLEHVVRDELGIEPYDLGIKVGIFYGEPGLEDPNFRAHVEETWGMRASSAYGLADSMSNLAAVCDDVYELHFLGQGALIAQIIDPTTGDDLPIEEGNVGELVLTNIDREAQGLIRYRTRDMVQIRGTGPCKCGRTGFRFRISGRSDDMLIVKGINVFPSGVAEVLNKLVPDVTGEFQIVLDRPGPYEVLDIDVEFGRGLEQSELEGLRRRVEKTLRDELVFTARVRLVPPGTVPRTDMGKAPRIVKTYDD